MILLLFLALYFPVYFTLRSVVRLSEDLTTAGLHALLALIATFCIVVALLWAKERIWG